MRILKVPHFVCLYRPPRLWLAAALAFAVIVPIPAADMSHTFSITQPPDWIREAETPATAAAGAAEAVGYLLLDYQTNVATEEQYTRIVKELRTAGGVAEGSTISAWYDPAYQRLLFHHIRVIRGGAATSRLSREAVQLLRRELSLESQVFDGTLTASVVLEDVRPGDRVDVAFTVRGRNPALAGRYADGFTCGWDVPVARERVRIVCPAERPLFFKMHGRAAQPARQRSAGLAEYTLEFANTPPVPAEDQTPTWHLTAPWLQVSEFKDWAEVRRWAADLYPPAALPPELELQADSWRTAAPLDRALAAIDWVQQNIRYVGVELGAGSYVPSSPATVCERRFGDCKDQSYLLCTLLRRLGLKAEPVLVNTWARRQVADLLPSPFAFDHVVVRIQNGNRAFFVDPTDVFQRGGIPDRFMPDYGFGLAAADGQGGLLALPARQGVAPSLEVLERFTATEWDQPALLEVETISRGGAADRMRQTAATNRMEDLAGDYLNYYAARYPGIQPDGELRLADDPAANVFRSSERYRLPEFWREQDDAPGYHAMVFADAIIDALPNPQTKVRTTPLAVAHPHHVSQRIEIELPEPWEGKPKSLKFSNTAFELAVRHEFRDRTVTLSYDYRSRADSVPAKEAARYQRSLLDLDPELGFEIRTQEDAVPANPKAPAALPLGAGIASFLLLGVGAVLVYRRVARSAVSLPVPEPDRALGLPQGLGGWLILVAVGLFTRPVLAVVYLGQLAPALTTSSWTAFTDPAGPQYHGLWMPFILFELVANIALVVAGVLLLIFFFERRRAFPRAYIAFLIGQAAIALVDFALGRQVLGADAPPSSPAQTFSMAVTSALWITYMLRSTRVKLTFIR